MDASSAAKAFDTEGGGGFACPSPVLRVIPGDVSARGDAAPDTGLRHDLTPEAAAEPAGVRFGQRRGVNWPAIGVIAGLHAVLFAGLVAFDVVKLDPVHPEPMMVDLIAVAPPPSPPEPTFQPKLEDIPPVIVPPQLDILPPRESPVQAVVADTPPPESRPAVVAAPTPAPAAATGPASTISVDNLAATMIEAEPPRYPVESRRRKEQGTVVLLVTVGTDGRVADIRVSTSSGFSRLDNAALSAVKKWRWAPIVRGGQPVTVQGYVEIPFVLRKA